LRSAQADELSIEDVLTVEHDVIPLDGADVFQQGEIDSIGDRVALNLRLPFAVEFDQPCIKPQLPRAEANKSSNSSNGCCCGKRSKRRTKATW
jgi:hypothetical protein